MLIFFILKLIGLFFLQTVFKSPKLYEIITVMVAIVASFAWLIDLISKLEPTVKVLKKVQIFFFKPKEDVELVKLESRINFSKLSVITNPDNEYIANPENVKHLIDYIKSTEKDNQIIALTGTAGIGKTKLVEHVCVNEIQNEYRVQIYVDFETVNSASSIKGQSAEEILVKQLEEAKKKMNAALGGGGNDRDDDYHSLAKDFQTPTILFIDNYEQILVNPRLDQLIRKQVIQPFSENNPLIKTIITSREHIDWANNFNVKELSNTTPEVAEHLTITELLEFTAVKLFCKIHNQLVKRNSKRNRVDFIKAEFVVIVELCNVVSCLPLGIHLIASRSVEINIKTIKENLKHYLQHPLPDSFKEFGERHTNLYNVFKWNYDSLTEKEKQFYKHLTYFQNGFFIENLPAFQNLKNLEMRDLIEKLSRKSLIREQDYKEIKNTRRYEIFILFKELLIAEDPKLDSKLDKTYLGALYKNYNDMLEKMDSEILGINSENIDFVDTKARLRLDYENIEYFIKDCQEEHPSLAANMLVKLEGLLNEIGPYIKLEPLYDPIIQKVKNKTYKARLLMSKARVLKSTENSRKEALSYVEEAINILSNETEITETLGDAYRIATYLSSQTSNFELGEFIVKKVSSFNTDNQSRLGTLNHAFIVLEEARYYDRMGNISQAELRFEKVIALMSGYKIQQGKALNQSALFYWRLGFSEKAEAQFKMAILNYEGIGEDRWILGFKTNLGLLYCDLNKLQESKAVTEEVYEALKHQGPYGWAVINLLNKGRIISRYDKTQQRFEEAEYILKECHSKFESIGYCETMVLASAELAELYYKYDNYEKALKHALICIEEAKKYKLNRWMRYFRALCIVGLISYKNGDKEDSIKSLVEAEQLINSFENNQWLSYKLTSDRFNELKNLNHAE
jgi:tetratricopeptide (TPR) repeat protein/energy-coupling factor transporter ATP-binding protein EcfA2